eukprot:1108965-Rhodomonas_salina.3
MARASNCSTREGDTDKGGKLQDSHVEGEGQTEPRTGQTRGDHCQWMTTAATAIRRVTTPYLRRLCAPARTAASSVLAL